MIIRSGDMSARGVYWLAAAMLLCVPRLATPQSAVAAAPRAWVAVSAAIASQAEGDEECPNVCGPVGGAGLAIGLSASARLSPRTAVVVEGMLGPSLHAEQTRRLAGGFLELSVQHRDVPVSGGLKFALTNPDLAVSAHAVALIGVSRRRTTLVGLRRTSFPPSAVAYEDTLVDLVPAFGAGMDVVMRVRHNVAFVPSLRAHFIGGDDTPSNQPPMRGVGWALFAAGLGVAVGF